ncbi:MAG: hypothetical protein ACXWYS_02490 [Gaiellaceae bacterium]
MTSHVARLYALAVALLVFFLTWAAIAARPLVGATTTDPRVAALVAREQRLRHESIAVRRLVQQRWAVYRVHLRGRQAQIAAAHQRAQAAAPAPPVRIVNLPPLTVTRTS